MTSHLKLGLVESRDLAQSRNWQLPPSQYSNRASSLTPSSLSFLSQIGAWPHVDTSRVQPYCHMRVWDGLSSAAGISFDSPTTPATPIASMTENQNLTRALLTRLSTLDPISQYENTTVTSIDLGPLSSSSSSSPPEASSLNLSSYPHLTLSSGAVLAARLLVGADGLNSPVRTFAGIRSRGWDYNRHGVVATVKLQRHDSSTFESTIAYQRFMPSGPIALLALPDDFATLVWTTTPQNAAHLKSLSNSDLAAMIDAAFRLEMVDLKYMHSIPSGQAAELAWREKSNASAQHTPTTPLPGRVLDVQPGSVASFPLRFRHADTYISSRIALIGDAAHTIHPLAGQGLNMGLGDVRALVAAIESCVQHGGDIGVEGNLEAFESSVYASNARMLGVVDKLHWLYAVENPLAVVVRACGLGLVNRLDGLKAVLMAQAGGLHSLPNLPR